MAGAEWKLSAGSVRAAATKRVVVRSQGEGLTINPKHLSKPNEIVNEARGRVNQPISFVG
jgi:hypothetical protein